MKSRTDLLQGTLTMLVLKSLSIEDMHGYAITAHIHQVSKETLRVEEGSLYPALHRLEQEGWIRSEWQMTETKRRARVYSITVAGRRQLRDEQENWTRLTKGVAHILHQA